MHFHCQQANQCFVDCDSGNGITCPDLASGTFIQTQWDFTTTIPTTTPTPPPTTIITTSTSTNATAQPQNTTQNGMDLDSTYAESRVIQEFELKKCDQ